MKRIKWIYIFIFLFVLGIAALAFINKSQKNTDVSSTLFSTKKIYNLCTFFGYEDMTIEEYRNKFAQIADKDGFLPFLDSLKLESKNNLSYDSKEEQFIELTLIPITAEDYLTWRYTSSIAAGKAVLDYEITRNILKPGELTVGSYISSINGIKSELAEIIDNSNMLGNNSIQNKLNNIAAKFTNSSIAFTISGQYYDDMTLHTPEATSTEPDTENETVLPSEWDEYSEAADRLLNLLTDGYDALAVEEFDKKILEDFNESPSLANDFALVQQNKSIESSLSEFEKDFLYITLPATVARNTAFVESVTMNTKEQAAVMDNQIIEQFEGDKYYLFEYRIRYEISDKDSITVKERDNQIKLYQKQVAKYMESKDWNELYTLGEDGVKRSFVQMAARCSTTLITIKLDSFHANFESTDMTDTAIQ